MESKEKNNESVDSSDCETPTKNGQGESSKPEKNDPRALITRDILEAAVRKDLGKSASLKSFEIKDFTKPGDNYACVVTSALCHIENDEKTMSKSYVLKLNPMYDVELMKGMLNQIFLREGGFFTDVSLALNNHLMSINQPCLRVPECLHVSYEKDREVLVTKDLRVKKFKMIDRTIGMDITHTTLVLQELARLHSVGYIHKKILETSGSTLLEKYPNMIDEFLEKQEQEDHFRNIFASSNENVIKLLEKAGYEKAIQWLKERKQDSLEIWKDVIQNCSDSFETICHGDPWNNNFLFRYDEDGSPYEVALVDLQMCRITSLANDLNYFFFSSVNGDVRMENFDKFINIYYEAFEKIIVESAICPMPFTVEELKEEYKSKIVFGAFSGMFLVPLVLREAEDVPNFVDIMDENKMAEFMESELSVAEKQMNKPAYKKRFLAIFDDLEYYNVY